MVEEKTPVQFQAGSNIEELAAMVDAMASGSGPPLDKLETGAQRKSNFRRILPQHPNMIAPAQVVPVHFGIGPNSRQFVCPREISNNVDVCPVCQVGFQTIRDGNKDAGQELLPNWRAYVNTVKLNQDGTLAEEKVYVLSLNKGQFDSLVDEFSEYGDITNLETGRNVDIQSKDEVKGKFTVKNLNFRFSNPVPFPGDTSVLEGTHDLTEFVELVSAEEMATALDGGSANGQVPFEARPALPAGDPPTTTEHEEPVAAGAFANSAEDAEPEAETPTPAASKVDTSDAMARLRERQK